MSCYEYTYIKVYYDIQYATRIYNNLLIIAHYFVQRRNQGSNASPAANSGWKQNSRN